MRNLRASLVLLVLLGATPALADGAAEVRSAHADYFKTLTTQGSEAALRRYYAADYRYLGVDGKVIDREGLSARMKRNGVENFALTDDLQRLTVNGDSAVIQGHSTTVVTDHGKTMSNTEGYTEVWMRRGDGWQIVAEQVTPQKKP